MACLTVSQMMTFSADKTNKPFYWFIGLLVLLPSNASGSVYPIALASPAFERCGLYIELESIPT